jgi:hypothetical protein
MGVAWLTALTLGLTPYVAGGASAEVRAGAAPLYVNEGAQASVAAVLTPVVAVGARDAETRLRLAYAPRFYRRTPNAAGSDRVLLLHQGELVLDQRLSAAVRWQAIVQGYAGDVDYLSFPTVLGTSQAAVPQSTSLASLAASTGVTIDASRTTTHGLYVRASHVRPLDDQAPPPPVPVNGVTPAPFLLPRNTSVGGLYTIAHRLNRIDTIGFDGDAAYYAFVQGLKLLAFTPQLRWHRALGATDSLVLAAGVTISDRLHNVPNAAPRPRWSVTPVGLAELTRRLDSDRDLGVEMRTGFAVTYFVDQVLGTGTTRGMAHFGLLALLSPDVSAGIDVSFATNMSVHPLPGNPDETLLYVTAPVRWVLSPEITLEGGGRFYERAPHLAAANWEPHGTEFWVYAGATVAFSTLPERRGRGAAAARASTSTAGVMPRQDTEPGQGAGEQAPDEAAPEDAVPAPPPGAATPDQRSSNVGTTADQRAAGPGAPGRPAPAREGSTPDQRPTPEGLTPDQVVPAAPAAPEAGGRP